MKSITKSRKSFFNLTTIAMAVCIVIAISTLFGCAKTDENGFTVDRNGCLLSYSGDETEITLPDNVTSISADAFKGNPNADKIEKININSSLESIEKGAFSKLSSLKSFTVAEGNLSYFEVLGYLVGKNDNAVYLSSIETLEDSYNFAKLIDTLQNGYKYYGEIFNIWVENCMIDISWEDNSSGDMRGYINSVSIFGYEKEFVTKEVLDGNFLVKLYQTNDAFIISKNANLDDYSSKTWIFTEYGTYENIMPIVDIYEHTTYYNDSVYSYYKLENGKLGYTRSPRKYTYSQTKYSELQHCISLDEFCKEEGYVSFENGKLNYITEKSYVVSDLYDMYEMFENWCEKSIDSNVDCFDLYDVPRFETLDELLEYNKGLYERAY